MNLFDEPDDADLLDYLKRCGWTREVKTSATGRWSLVLWTNPSGNRFTESQALAEAREAWKKQKGE